MPHVGAPAQVAPSVQQLKWDDLVSSQCCLEFKVEAVAPELKARVAKAPHNNPSRTLMYFKGRNLLGASIILRGAPIEELAVVKRVIRHACYVAYMQRLETAYLAAVWTTCSSAVAPLLKGEPGYRKVTRRQAAQSSSVQREVRKLLREPIMSNSPHVQRWFPKESPKG